MRSRGAYASRARREWNEGRRLLVGALAAVDAEGRRASTQRELAARMGVSHAAVGGWANGKRLPDWYCRTWLERELGISAGAWDSEANRSPLLASVAKPGSTTEAPQEIDP